jgi:hypothetical protein
MPQSSGEVFSVFKHQKRNARRGMCRAGGEGGKVSSAYFFSKSRISVSSTTSAGGAGGGRGGLLLLHHGHELVGGLYDDEENHRGCDQEADDCPDDQAKVELNPWHNGVHHLLHSVHRLLDLHGLAADRDLEVGRAAAAEASEDRFDDAFGEGCHNIAEGSADDHTSGEVHHVAFENELFEFVEHKSGLLG